MASHACCLQPPAGAAGGRRCRQAGSGGGCSSQRRTAGRPGNVAAHAAGSMCWCKAAPCWCQSRLEEVGGWWVCVLSPSARTSQQGDPAEMYPEGSRTVVPINHQLGLLRPLRSCPPPRRCLHLCMLPCICHPLPSSSPPAFCVSQDPMTWLESSHHLSQLAEMLCSPPHCRSRSQVTAGTHSSETGCRWCGHSSALIALLAWARHMQVASKCCRGCSCCRGGGSH